MLGLHAIGGAPIGATSRTGAAAPPPSGYRYWRVLITQAAGGYVGVYSLDFQDANGNSLCVGGTPNASSTYAYYSPDRAFPNGKGGTDKNWISNNEGAGAWIGYDFTKVGAVAKVLMAGYGPCNDAPSQPVTTKLQYSQDKVSWVDAFEMDRPAGGWVSGQAVEFDAPPPAEVDASVSQARVFSIFAAATVAAAASQARVFAIYTFPAQATRTSQARAFAVTAGQGPMNVSQGRVIAVVKGRVADPRVRAWTFTLDGHDFYVLRLGDAETLVYDTSSKQWVNWDTPAHGAWRPLVGTTWTGAHKLAATFGTNIVAGDDEFGILWFLNPIQAWDDDVLGSATPQPFTRVLTGQVLAKGRQQLACYAVFVDGDNYGLTADFVPYVRLDTSDDQGRNFDQHDTLTVSGNANDMPDTWYSLGQFGSPGRIFRLTDNGVFARVDAMKMNDDAG